MTHGHGHRRAATHHGDSSAGSHHTGDSASSPIHHETTQALSSPGEHADHKVVRPSHPTDHVVITPLGTKSKIADRHMDIPPFNLGLLASDEVPQKPAGQQPTPGEAAGREAKINGATSIEDLVKRQGNDAIFVNKQSDANDQSQAS